MKATYQEGYWLVEFKGKDGYLYLSEGRTYGEAFNGCCALVENRMDRLV